jgi:hypothetical protein
MQTMFSIQMPTSLSINQLIIILMAMVLGKNKFLVGMKIYKKIEDNWAFKKEIAIMKNVSSLQTTMPIRDS